eukprot:7468072-Lingulodinium_polyedra.AAC.1
MLARVELFLSSWGRGEAVGLDFGRRGPALLSQLQSLEAVACQLKRDIDPYCAVPLPAGAGAGAAVMQRLDAQRLQFPKD